METFFFLDAPRFRRKDHFCCKFPNIGKFVLLLEVAVKIKMLMEQ